MAVLDTVKDALTGRKNKANADIQNVPQPLPLDAFEEWNRLEARRAATAKRLAEVERKCEELTRQAAHEADVRAMLEGGEVSGPVEQALAAARRERQMATEALELANRERTALRSRLSRPATENMLPWHRAVVEAIAKKALELHELVQLERQGIDAVEAAGLNSGALATHGSARPSWLSADDLANWLRWCLDVGYLPNNREWRAALSAVEGGS